MASSPLTPEFLARLQAVDTPSVCNAIEVAQGQRGFAGYTRATVLSSAPESPALVGFARTARIASVAAPDEPIEQTRKRRLDYFRHMAAGAADPTGAPSIAVVEDVDHPSCPGAWWGEVHTAVHKRLGMTGALTNGAMRDLGDLEPGFPVIAGSIGPSHAFVHVTEIGVPVTLFGLTIATGDLVHADRHGAVVIPDDVLPSLNAALDTLEASEALILEPARRPGFDIEALERAWALFEKART